MKVPTPDEIARALEAHKRIDLPGMPGRRKDINGGVLVPLVWEPHPTVIFTVRSLNLRQHAGQVCFPGGMPEAEDADLGATAMRESREELGITQVVILGQLSSVPVFTSEQRIYSFVGQIAPEPLSPNPGEVSEIIKVSLRDVLGWPHIDAIAYVASGMEGVSPVFSFGQHRVFGATAHTFLELLQIVAPLFDLSVPPFKTGRFAWTDVLPPEFASQI